MKIEPMIVSTSDEAAKLVTVTGWVDRFGHFWGSDERQARWCGCTHIVCECGAVTPKSRTKCEACLERARIARYEALPLVEWDGETPLALWDSDRYFFSAEEVDEWIECDEIDPADVRLVICEPEHLHQLDADTWTDELPEYGELPPEVEAAVDALNKVIAAQVPSCWYPGKERIQWVTASTVPVAPEAK